MRYEIREMSFGEILATALELLQNHFGLLVGLSLVTYAPLALLGVGAAAAELSGSSPFGVAAVLLSLVLTVLTIAVIAPIVSAAITYAVGKLYLGERVTLEAALRTASSMLWPLVTTSFISGMVILITFLILIIPGVYFMLSFLLLWQVMVLERVFGTAALQRSHDLIKGFRMRAFGVIFTAALIVAVLQGIFQATLYFEPVLGSIASTAALAVGNVYTAAVSVVLYFDVRHRKDGFDLDHLRRMLP